MLKLTAIRYTRKYNSADAISLPSLSHQSVANTKSLSKEKIKLMIASSFSRQISSYSYQQYQITKPNLCDERLSFLIDIIVVYISSSQRVIKHTLYTDNAINSKKILMKYFFNPISYRIDVMTHINI